MAQLINQVLHNRYRIQSLLGRQIGRRTFLATDLQTEQSVVVKLLLFNPDFNWDDLKLFERETEVLKSLDHPTIPKYLDYFEVETELGKGFALVQTYIKAKSLQDWLQSGRSFSEAEVKAIATSLLEILDYLHNRQPSVIHRDLKPSNILLGDRTGNSPGQVYLVDFGSVQTATQSGTITVVGTFGYMPPEQFGGRTIPASDLYSLGATLIYLLTKTHPADLPSRNGCVQFQAEHLASEQFQTWLKYLIQPDLSQRLKSAQLAMETLHNNQLPTLGTIRSKPLGSRVRLTKTDEQLQLIIPQLQLKEKLKLIPHLFLPTFVTCFLLLVCFLAPVMILPFAPPILLILFLFWKDDGYKIFENTQLSINENEFYATNNWLIFKTRYTAKTKNIIKIEFLPDKKKITDSVNPHIYYSGLYIWLGNQRYSLRGLTAVEQEWLAFELSDWLDLPIASNVIDVEFKNPDPVSISPTDANELSRIRRPDTTQCTVTKDAETIEISAPVKSVSLAERLVGRFVLWIFPVVCMVFILLPMVLILLFINQLFAVLILVPILVLILVLILIWMIVDILWGSRNLSKLSQPSKVVLRIDQQTISLWEQSDSPKERCLKQATRKSIKELKLVHSGNLFHILISTDSVAKDFFVGNRSYWLSETEAHWLAHELSSLLELPVRDVEVIVQSH